MSGLKSLVVVICNRNHNESHQGHALSIMVECSDGSVAEWQNPPEWAVMNVMSLPFCAVVYQSCNK